MICEHLIISGVVVLVVFILGAFFHMPFDDPPKWGGIPVKIIWVLCAPCFALMFFSILGLPWFLVSFACLSIK